MAVQGRRRKRTLSSVALRRKRLLVVFLPAWLLLSMGLGFCFPWDKSLAIGSGSVGAKSQSWTLGAGRS